MQDVDQRGRLPDAQELSHLHHAPEGRDEQDVQDLEESKTYVSENSAMSNEACGNSISPAPPAGGPEVGWLFLQKQRPLRKHAGLINQTFRPS